jgi:hypothetical protein
MTEVLLLLLIGLFVSERIYFYNKAYSDIRQAQPAPAPPPRSAPRRQEPKRSSSQQKEERKSELEDVEKYPSVKRT